MEVSLPGGNMEVFTCLYDQLNGKPEMGRKIQSPLYLSLYLSVYYRLPDGVLLRSATFTDSSSDPQLC